MLKLIIFIGGSAGIVYVSWTSLTVLRSHGFYRFFAWEFLLVLFLLNMEGWFRDALSPHQIVSWVLLILSAFLVVHAVHLLRRTGKPDPRRDDMPMLGIEKTTTLVTKGAYRYIRHPMYSSLFLLGWGIFFKDPSWPGVSLTVGVTIFLLATAKIEEAENKRFFGRTYQDYMERTKMFIPFLF
jgi:protein-S-isoprenylcysteine O-methyltransferase Ste14